MTNKFQLGDRVKVAWDSFGWAGQTGTVTRTPDVDHSLYEIELDTPFRGYTNPVWHEHNLAPLRARPATTRSAVQL